MAAVPQPGVVPDAAAQLVAFCAALGRIGLSIAVQDAHNEHGFTGMYGMMIYSKEQIKRVCTVIRDRPVNPLHISIEQEQLLTAMRHWVKLRVRTNRSIESNLFTRDVAIAEAIKMVNIAEETITEKESDVKLPEKFKMASKWIIFSEAMDTYLNRLKGQGRIPLNYVIRTLALPVPGTNFDTEQEMIIATAPLLGDQYNLDNERVYGIVKQLTLEGPAWSYITSDVDRAKNGRAAWMALRAHYEGESFLNKQKEDAYKAIDVVHYKGERSTFTFEHFTGILTKAYNDLQCYGEPVLESKKVRDLLSKIADPKLESCKQAICINNTYKNNFSLAVNFLAESVETVDKSKTRFVGEISQINNTRLSINRGRGRHNNNGRNSQSRSQSGRSLYRGSRSHGGHGRGTRGRGGRGRDALSQHSNNTYIPPSEWQAMTQDQRQAYLQARAASRIHAITTSNGTHDDISTVTNITNFVPIPSQLAQVSHTNSQQTPSGMNSIGANTAAGVSSLPFGGRAAHRG
jgi:hypothetical protein